MIRNILSKHKNTIVSVITAMILVYLLIRLFTGQITVEEFGTKVGVLSGVSVTLVGLLSPDGTFKKKSS